jgi:hypothetical protein
MNLLHRMILGCLFTVVNWLIVKEFVVDLTLINWIFIEIILAVSFKLYIFTVTKIH